jgi:hypothetical protein
MLDQAKANHCAIIPIGDQFKIYSDILDEKNVDAIQIKDYLDA